MYGGGTKKEKKKESKKEEKSSYTRPSDTSRKARGTVATTKGSDKPKRSIKTSRKASDYNKGSQGGRGSVREGKGDRAASMRGGGRGEVTEKRGARKASGAKKAGSGRHPKESSKRPSYGKSGAHPRKSQQRKGVGVAAKKRGERLKDITGQEMFSGMKAAKKIGKSGAHPRNQPARPAAKKPVSKMTPAENRKRLGLSSKSVAKESAKIKAREESGRSAKSKGGKGGVSRTLSRVARDITGMTPKQIQAVREGNTRAADKQRQKKSKAKHAKIDKQAKKDKKFVGNIKDPKLKASAKAKRDSARKRKRMKPRGIVDWFKSLGD